VLESGLSKGVDVRCYDNPTKHVGTEIKGFPALHIENLRPGAIIMSESITYYSTQEPAYPSGRLARKHIYIILAVRVVSGPAIDWGEGEERS
jgi:hypothetical protein